MYKSRAFLLIFSGVLLVACGKEGPFAAAVACDPETLRAESLQGDIERVRECLTTDVDLNAPNQDGVTPLMLAAANGHTDVVLALLEAGADANGATSEERVTALMFAAHWGHLETVQALVEHGAVATQQDSGDRTATDWAAMSANVPEEERLATARYLQANGASLRQMGGLELFLSVGGAPDLSELVQRETTASGSVAPVSGQTPR